MRKPIRAVAILIKDSQILLMWRNKEGKEYWTFPGGGVEGDEKYEDAVIRELGEETTVEGKSREALVSSNIRS
jgi:8-oxo-dGTP diphosphatase